MSTSINDNNIICIAGESGFIGQSISQFLKSKGFTIKPINRDDLKKGAAHIATIINGSSALINTIGSPIQGRWSQPFKDLIYQSRIENTQLLVDAIKRATHKPSIFITSSAVGIYNTSDEHDEYSDKYSSSYLGKVCREWENEAYHLSYNKELRLVIFRFGIVLGNHGGAFPKLKNTIKYFVGGRIGTGYQWFPYIHMDDVLNSVWHVLTNKKSMGIYNLVAPESLSYERFCRKLAQQMNRPYWLTVPNFVLKMLFSEGAMVITSGQHVKPYRLLNEDFEFKYPTGDEAIKELINSK